MDELGKEGGSKARGVISATRYNPNDEPAIEEQVAAANWELLRRVPDFQEVAQAWLRSESFRQKHGTGDPVYKNNVPARCALDWLLAPRHRYALAQHQLAARTFFSDPAANFGPITVEPVPEAQTGRLSECIERMFRVRPRLECREALRLDQPWPEAPTGFQEQFRDLITGHRLREVRFHEEGMRLLRLGNYLVEHKALSPDQALELGQYLFRVGDTLRTVTRDYKIAAIPRTYYSQRHLDEILVQVKQGIAYDPRTGHDWGSKSSFLGTRKQWQKFLAWEAHGGDAYRAAAEFLPPDCPKPGMSRRRHGQKSRSVIQAGIAGTVRNAVRDIQKWFPRLYPRRDLRPATLKA